MVVRFFNLEGLDWEQVELLMFKVGVSSQYNIILGILQQIKEEKIGKKWM